MVKTTGVVAAAWLLLFSGCVIPIASHPLVPPTEAKLPTELLGAYEWQNPDNGVVHRAEFLRPEFPCPDGVFAIKLWQSDSPDNVKTLLVFSERLGDYHVLHMPLVGLLHDQDDNDLMLDEKAERWEPERIQGYVLGRLRLQAGELGYSSFHIPSLAEAIEAGEIQGEVERRVSRGTERISKIRLTAKPEELRAFLLARQETALFEPVVKTAKRVSQPTP